MTDKVLRKSSFEKRRAAQRDARETARQQGELPPSQEGGWKIHVGNQTPGEVFEPLNYIPAENGDDSPEGEAGKLRPGTGFYFTNKTGAGIHTLITQIRESMHGWGSSEPIPR